MSGTEVTRHGFSEVEEDILRRTESRNKDGGNCMDIFYERREEMSSEEKAKEKMSYRDTFMGTGARSNVCEEDFMNNSDISEDDLIEEGDDESCFGMGMTKEKLEARRPWHNSIIIKMVGRSIGYHSLGGVCKSCGEPRWNHY